MMSRRLRPSRRSILAAALASACGSSPLRGEQPDNKGLAPLKTIAGGPLGCCVSTSLLRDSAYSGLLTENFSQVTPEWEMKMNVIMRPDGRLSFEAADAIAAFASQNAMRLHATTLVWYKHEPAAMQRLDGAGSAFAKPYRDYIARVVQRYRGRAAGWDVVNEPLTHDGDSLRNSLWSRNLGEEGYMESAFAHANEADPNAIHFINEYDLEARPNKRLLFMKLVERLLKRGTRIGGIGTQSHVKIDLPKGAAAAAFKDLASFGLPIHVSELDVSFGRRSPDLRSVAQKRDLQERRIEEIVEAYMDLPQQQRYALTMWGLRDRDSWLRLPPMAGDGSDEPLLFNDAGKPKPLLKAFAKAFAA